MGYRLGDVDVTFPADSPLVHDDGQGLPIHGLLGGCPAWQVETFEADADAARLAARLDFAGQPDLMALFPVAHELLMDVTLCGPALELPDVPRAAWELTLPVRRHMRLDARFLPTGETEPAKIEPGPLGDTVYDDLYTELEPRPTFVLAGGGRRLEVAFGEGYDVGVIYAPANDDVVCFEPMTAPTNPFEGGDVRWVEPGASFEAGFEVRVG
jgi:hypothetical protein